MVIAVDMGGTHTRVAALADPTDPQFTLLARFATNPDYPTQVDQLAAAIDAAPAAAGVCFAVGAQLTPDGLAIDKSYTMPGFVGQPLVRAMAARCHVPVRAANDNLCANLAETLFGPLAGISRAAYLTVSTGTGAGIRLGALDEGAFLYLAQVGHHIVDPAGPLCSCGQRGCVQAVTGGQQIEARYGVSADALDDPAAWQEITTTLAIAIVNLARVARVDAVVVGGGIGYNAPYLRAHLPNAVQAHSPGLSIAVLPPALGEDAPLVGAALLLRDDLHYRIFH